MTDCHLMMYTQTNSAGGKLLLFTCCFYLFLFSFGGGGGEGRETLKLLYKPYVLACGI